jgi:hypothetical protein
VVHKPLFSLQKPFVQNLSGGSVSESESDGSRQAAASAAGNKPKKQPKARKQAKDMMPAERRIELDKRTGRREAVKNR